MRAGNSSLVINATRGVALPLISPMLVEINAFHVGGTGSAKGATSEGLMIVEGSADCTSPLLDALAGVPSRGGSTSRGVAGVRCTGVRTDDCRRMGGAWADGDAEARGGGVL